ncbi:MAG TPA: hypothetical protein VEA35_11175 [Ramlibacter sp.]|nr:hypothetical protein [Ramlibacter sp.]
MLARKLMWIAWPGFIAACALQVVVFALVDPLELEWAGHSLGWTRQAVYAAAFFLFWFAGMLSSALTALLQSSSNDSV